MYMYFTADILQDPRYEGFTYTRYKYTACRFSIKFIYGVFDYLIYKIK